MSLKDESGRTYIKFSDEFVIEAIKKVFLVESH